MWLVRLRRRKKYDAITSGKSKLKLGCDNNIIIVGLFEFGFIVFALIWYGFVNLYIDCNGKK